MVHSALDLDQLLERGTHQRRHRQLHALKGNVEGVTQRGRIASSFLVRLDVRALRLCAVVLGAHNVLVQRGQVVLAAALAAVALAQRGALRGRQHQQAARHSVARVRGLGLESQLLKRRQRNGAEDAAHVQRQKALGAGLALLGAHGLQLLWAVRARNEDLVGLIVRRERRAAGLIQLLAAPGAELAVAAGVADGLEALAAQLGQARH